MREKISNRNDARNNRLDAPASRLTTLSKRPWARKPLPRLVAGVAFLALLGAGTAVFQPGAGGSRGRHGFAATHYLPLAQWGFGKGPSRFVALPVLEQDGDTLRIIDHSPQSPQKEQQMRRLPGGGIQYFRNGTLVAMRSGMKARPAPGARRPTRKTLILNDGQKAIIALNRGNVPLSALCESRKIGFLSRESCPGVQVEDK